MAESPSHKFGQIIGNLIEDLIEPLLAKFAKDKGLFLDCQKYARKARTGKKISWQDDYANTHDLDFVIERDGTQHTLGVPVAFIEVAWRRYTKHSRNKAQEIQGAILPLAEKYRYSSPFLGAVLSGEFTAASITQLRSLGFHILYFPYETVVGAFSSVKIDVAFDESTSDKAFKSCIQKIEALSAKSRKKLIDSLVLANSTQLDEFISALEKRLDRMVISVLIVPLYGVSNEFRTLDDAVKFLENHTPDLVINEFRKHEVLVSFSNGDRVEGTFKDKETALRFLAFVAKQ